MTTYLCWHLPDGTPSRGEEVHAESMDEAAATFAGQFFDDNQGEWLGGDVVVHELDANLDGMGEAMRYEADVALTDLAITTRRIETTS